MQQHFNTAGPVFPGKHYCIDPIKRLDWEEVRYLIDAEKYFVLHAPRQTGKTSTLLAMMHALNQQGDYLALYANIEAAQIARQDAIRGINTITSVIAHAARLYLDNHTLIPWVEQRAGQTGADNLLTRLLEYWATQSGKPTILMLDEVDALVGDTLISLLRQIRAGYAQRPATFPQSIILCGVRDVRDYRMQNPHKETITGGSAFNIKAKSLRMGNFTPQEVEMLYQQHTEETGQVFSPEIFARLWEDTAGQPWLVNALGNEMIWEDREARDRISPITLQRYQAARERLIGSRATHLDQLTDKLKEPRVHQVIAALLSGDVSAETLATDDIQYVADLGLIESRPQVRIANRIYQEVIPRELTWTRQITITHEQSWYVTPEHRIDMPKLLAAFQQFFRENADAWIERFDYKEAGPQLLLQAFLQRIINGGGRINREYGLGRKRTDLFIEWPLEQAKGFYGPVQRVVLELKILRHNLDKTISDGLQQVTVYAQQCGADEAHLVIFNRAADTAWENKIWHQQISQEGWTIGVWGA